MTEGNLAHQDIFIRQAILGGNRVPVIWGPDISLLQVFHKHADADVGQMGKGTDAIITTNSVKQVKRKQVPYASLYMECDESMKEYCSSEKYCSTCWIDREDGITPKAKQVSKDNSAKLLFPQCVYPPNFLSTFILFVINIS